MKLRLSLSILLAAATLVPAAMVHGAIFAEGFDGSPAGTSLKAAAFGWAGGSTSNIFTADPNPDTHAGWTGIGIYGASSNQNVLNILTKSVPAHPPTGITVMSYDLWAYSGGLSDPKRGVKGLGASGLMYYNPATGNYFGIQGQCSITDGTGWDYTPFVLKFTTVGLDGVGDTTGGNLYVFADSFFDTAVSVKVFADFDNNKVWASMSDGVNTDTTQKYSVNGAKLRSAVAGLFLVEDTRRLSNGAGSYFYRKGVDMDNISIATIPEPGSLLALATGLVGLVGLRRVRRH